MLEARNVVISGPPGIGKTWLLEAVLEKWRSDDAVRVVYVRLEDRETVAKDELRLVLSDHFGGKFFPNEYQGLAALTLIVPEQTVLLIDKADAHESVQAVLWITDHLTNVTAVVTSRAQQFRGFEHIPVHPRTTVEAEKHISEFELDDATRAEVLEKGAGNPQVLRQRAYTAKYGGELDKDRPLQSMLKRWPEVAWRALWLIGLLPSSILTPELLVDVGGLNRVAQRLLEDNAVIESVSRGGRPFVSITPVLVLACQREVLPTVPTAALNELRADAARYYIAWLRTGPTTETIDVTRGNLMYLLTMLDDQELRAELALELIGDHIDDPTGYLPARGLAGLLLDPELKQPLEDAAKQVEGITAARLLKNLGLFCHWANQPDAELLLLSAKQLYDRLQDIEGSASTSWILGTVAEDAGLYDKAVALFREPLTKPRDPSIVAVSNHLEGCAHYHWEDFDRANVAFERASDDDGRLEEAIHLRIARGLAYIELADGKAERALPQLERVRAWAIRLDRPRDAARSTRHIGKAQMLLGNLEAAHESIRQARDEFERLGDQRGLGATLCLLATVRREQGHPQEAAELAHKSRTIAGADDGPTVPMRSPVGLARAEEELAELGRVVESQESFEAHIRRARNAFDAIHHPRQKQLAARLGSHQDPPFPAVRGIVFDLVDTLAPMAPEAYEAVKREMSVALRVDHPRFKAAWAKSREWASTMSSWTPTDRIKWVADELGSELTPEEVEAFGQHEKRLWTESVSLDPEAHRVLSDLQARNIPWVLVTNGSSAMRDIPSRLGLDRYPCPSLLSCEVGVVKPKPRIYREALKRLELPAKACLYVGDGSDRELEGAKAVGMFAVRMRAHPRPSYSTRESLDWDATVDALGDLLERMENSRV